MTARENVRVPEGWHTVTPRILAHGAQQLIEFLEHVFNATGDYNPDRPSEISIGDSVLLISDAGIREPASAFLYVYVADTDETYRRAIQAGATSLEEPDVMPYGDRRAMVRTHGATPGRSPRARGRSPEVMALDPLSDLLRVVRLDGAFFFAVEAAEPWSVETAAARELSPRILPAAEHLISYHILTEGRCYGGVRGEDQVELIAGDVLVFPHGDAHLMSSARGLRPGPRVHTAAPARYPQTVHLGNTGPLGAVFVCGFLGCDRQPFNPLLAALPRRLHVRGMSGTWVAAFSHQLTEESRLGRPGSDTVLTRMAELMFIEVLRRYLEDLPAGQTGWLAGLRDEMVGRALALLHARPGHPWTLDELAREAASSRSSVAKRFGEVVGQPPMQYLTQWRMQVAANLLVQTGAKVAAIGAEVGYDSEAAFSRAFKKATGLAPGAWRDARARSRDA